MSTDRYTPMHQAHIGRLRKLPAILDSQGLRLGTQYVMFFAEADLMRAHAVKLTSGTTRADVLEIGLGLGVFADQLARLDIGSYTAIEPHHGVASLTTERVLASRLPGAKVITEPWQTLSLPDASYDAIMYDTWPPRGRADKDFALFVETVAVKALRPGGRFSFFHSGTQLSPARQHILDQHFAAWDCEPYEMAAEIVPPAWTKPTRQFLIPIATTSRS